MSKNIDQMEAQFTYLKTARTAKVWASKDAMFGDVVTMAYKELGESKNPHDHILCENGPSLDKYLDKTLYTVVHDYCKNARFDIKGPSGGAFFYWGKNDYSH